MSWLFGYIGDLAKFKINSPETPIHSYQSSNLLLYVGGNKQTIFHKLDKLNSSCWIAEGVGLKKSGNGYKNLGINDWDDYLSQNEINLNSINGHYVVVKYGNNEIKFFTDALGLRDLYIVKLPAGWGFTTRIDWLKYFINPEIDLKEFGSRWLLQNQISQNSLIKNATRLVSANATIINGRLEVEHKHWKPEIGKENGKAEFEEILNGFLSVENKKINLSLSGGLDSRLLLSLLSNVNFGNWETHTFGDPDHPDSQIARDLMKSIDLENNIINDVIPSSTKTEDLLNNYAVRSIVTNPVSSILNLRFYERISDELKIIIDGGFGEIWRREFANRLLYLGKKALQDRNVERIFELLKHQKANFFNDEALNEMKTGALNQISNIIQESEDVQNIGVGKWIDLFSIKTRLPNYYAPEQSRVDDFVTSFMPFVQKDLLKVLFNLKDSDKNNGNLLKEIIKKNSPQLTHIQLVKGNITHTFNSSSLNARLNATIKHRLGKYYKSNLSTELIYSAKDFILDFLHSSSVRTYEFYDSNKIEKLAKGFSNNDKGIISELDWFLSFELFREGISN
jgi:hypothetical protein